MKTLIEIELPENHIVYLVKIANTDNGKAFFRDEDIKLVNFTILPATEGKTKNEIRSKVAEVFESFDDMREADMDSFIDQIDDIYMTLQKPSQSQPEGVDIEKIKKEYYDKGYFDCQRMLDNAFED